MHCWIFSRILASVSWTPVISLSSVVTTRNVPRHCQISSGMQNCPSLGITDIESMADYLGDSLQSLSVQKNLYIPIFEARSF